MPEPLKTLTSKAVVLSQSNIDTDQIIPGRFLSTTTREGLGRWAFHCHLIYHAATGMMRLVKVA